MSWFAGITQLEFLPVTWVAAAGLSGLLAMFALWLAMRRRLGWEAALFVGGTLIFYYVSTGVEVRRHFAMVAGFAAAFTIVRHLPRGHAWLRSREARFMLAGLASIARPLHIYFLYSYVGKPSFVLPDPMWKDYLAMNRILASDYKGRPVLAAGGLERWGWELPLAMEETTSWSQGYHAAVHVQLTPKVLNLFTLMQATKEAVPFGQRLGYRAIVWGPLEQSAWGERVRKRFLGEKLAETGSVGLYRLEDSWRKIFEEERAGGGDFAFRIGKQLMAAGWRAEALEAFAAADSAPAHTEMARIWYTLGADMAVAYHLRRAETLKGASP